MTMNQILKLYKSLAMTLSYMPGPASFTASGQLYTRLFDYLTCAAAVSSASKSAEQDEGLIRSLKHPVILAAHQLRKVQYKCFFAILEETTLVKSD